MNQTKNYIEIKNKKIPTTIRNYKNSTTIKIYFKGSTLNISKPKYLKNSILTKFIKQNEEKIYKEYEKILSTENKTIKHWNNGEEIFYKGKSFTIQREESSKIELILQKDKSLLKLKMPFTQLTEEEIKLNADKAIKKLLKKETEEIMYERLPYWQQMTKIQYKSFKVRDAVSKYGSCKPMTKELYFSSRLAMLPLDKIDAIIVHELCHIIHKNHSQEFYNLVKKYIPNYKEIDKWLKANTYQLII